MRNLFLTVLLGLSAGFFSGALGISSAPILLPGIMLLNLVDNYKTAIGTVILTIIPPLSIFALIEYYRRDYINIPVALILMATVIIGAYMGSVFTTTYDTSEITLAYMTGGALFLLSLFWFYVGYSRSTAPGKGKFEYRGGPRAISL